MAEEWHMDAALAGLGVRLRASAKKDYYLRYYNDRGQGRKYRLGNATGGCSDRGHTVRSSFQEDYAETFDVAGSSILPCGQDEQIQ